jgi:hypothetical protein
MLMGVVLHTPRQVLLRIIIGRTREKSRTNVMLMGVVLRLHGWAV